MKLRKSKKETLLKVIACAIAATTIFVFVPKTTKPNTAQAARQRPIASNNIAEGEVGYLKLTKTATTTSVKDVWKIELGVSGLNPPPTYVDIMIVIDTTASMNDLPGGTNTQEVAQVYDINSRMNGAKAAAKVLINELWDPNYRHDIYRFGGNTMHFGYNESNTNFFDEVDFLRLMQPTVWKHINLTDPPGGFSSLPLTSFEIAPDKTQYSTDPLNDWSPKTSTPDSTMMNIGVLGLTSKPPTTGINGLVEYADKDALLHNIEMLYGMGQNTAIGQSMNQAGIAFYSGASGAASSTLVPSPGAQKMIDFQLNTLGMSTSNVIMKRALVVITDGLPNEGFNLPNEHLTGMGTGEFFDQTPYVVPDASVDTRLDPLYALGGMYDAEEITYGVYKKYETLSEDPANPGTINPLTPFKIYTVGIDLPQLGINLLKSSSKSITPGQEDGDFVNITQPAITTPPAKNRAEALKDHFKKIADELRVRSIKSTVYDQIGEEFELYMWEGATKEAETEYSYWLGLNVPAMLPEIDTTPNGVSLKKDKYVHYNSGAKEFEWRIDNFADYTDPDTLTYYVKLKPGFNIPGKTYTTNTYAYIDYTNVKGEAAVKFFPNPFVSPDGIVETPKPEDEFPKGEEFEGLGGYTPSLPSEGWKKPSGSSTEKAKEPTLTKEQAAANAKGKTLAEIAAEKKEAKKAAAQAEAKAKDPNSKVSNLEARAAEAATAQQVAVEVAQKTLDTATANATKAEKAAVEAKKASDAAQKDKSKTPEQKKALLETSKKAAATAKEAKNAVLKAEKTLKDKTAAAEKKAATKQKKNQTEVVPTPSPTPKV